MLLSVKKCEKPIDRESPLPPVTLVFALAFTYRGERLRNESFLSLNLCSSLHGRLFCSVLPLQLLPYRGYFGPSVFRSDLAYAEAFLVECFAALRILHYVFCYGETSTKFRLLFLDCLADFTHITFRGELVLEDVLLVEFICGSSAFVDDLIGSSLYFGNDSFH